MYFGHEFESTPDYQEWDGTAENRKGQFVHVFIRKGRFRVGNGKILNGQACSDLYMLETTVLNGF